VDVRTDGEFQSDPYLIPASQRRNGSEVGSWRHHYAAHPVIAICQDGQAASQTAAAWLRHHQIDAQTLSGGFAAWRSEQQPLLRTHHLPPRDQEGRTVWVTRARPKVVRVACPWLIRRFIDPEAAFLYVPPADVLTVAARAEATSFDVQDAFWSDRGQLTTFDTMLDEFGLATEPLLRLAAIVRGADTGKLDLTPQSGGLLAACLGYSRMFRDDLAQLEAALPLFDALYRWARDAVDERHG
jgi:rhodanese-related sulfurtransferase